MKRAVSNRRVLILCEGFTEEIYAKSLRGAYLSRLQQRNVAIEVVRHKKNDPSNLILEAKKRIKEGRRQKQQYTDVWLFFDNDNSPHLNAVFDEIVTYGIHHAYSSISIEFWFLLHFVNVGRAFSSNTECINELKKHWPTYHKTKINHFRELEPYLEIAIERAKSLESKIDLDDLSNTNPYTSVFKLVEFFKNLNK